MGRIGYDGPRIRARAGPRNPCHRVITVLTSMGVAGPWRLRVDGSPSTDPHPEAAVVPPVGIPGRVPGAVHDDLHRAGLIGDPFQDANEDAVAWVSRTDWVYDTELPEFGGGAERVDLVFGGIDTAARIELVGPDGTRNLGRTRNMHRSYRYDVTTDIREGRRGLLVHLASPYTEAESLREWTGPRPNAYPEPFQFIRKMACSFGWDWGITLPGAGLWRPVTVQAWSTARIARVRPLTDVDLETGEGIAAIAVDVERTQAGALSELVVEIALGGEPIASLPLPPGITDAATTVRLPQVRRWSPTGHGAPNLYELAVSLRTREAGAGSAELDRHTYRIGFRHIRLDRSPDAAGGAFTFQLDGHPIQIKGVNWIPEDILPGRMTRQRYRRRLEQAAQAHINLIRVWGGGLYETDEFYEICDELGLMVWQDFPFACAAYPEHEILRAEIRAEAEENVARLARHPSLVLYNGNNECDWLRGAEDWASQPGGEKDWGGRYYHQDLPEIVARVDPSRPYTPSSPWSGHGAITPNAPSHGTHHSWDVWNRLDYAHYRDSVPRFVAEFGWQALPAWRTIRDAVSERPLLPSSTGVLRRQKAGGGMEKLSRGLAPHVREHLDFDAWHYLTQWNQVRAVETGIQFWRGHWPVCSGTIAWQLNDLWPVISWSAIDGAGRFKPLYFALRDLYAPRTLTIGPTAADDGTDGLVAIAINDTPERWVGQLSLRRVADAGFDAARRVLPFAVPPRAVTRIPIPSDLAVFTDPEGEVLVAEIADGSEGREGGEGAPRAYWYAVEPRESTFVGAPPVIDGRATATGLTVTVTATTLLRDFLIQADRIHPQAVADRGLITVLPGESATITVTCPEPLDGASLAEPWVCSHLYGVLSGPRRAGASARDTAR